MAGSDAIRLRKRNTSVGIARSILHHHRKHSSSTLATHLRPAASHTRSVSCTESLLVVPPRSAAASEPAEVSPAYEYYGFVIYLLSIFSYLVFLAWAFLPDAVLHSLGIYYYPSRWWALAIPTWAGCGIIMILVVVVSLDLLRTPSLASYYTVTGT
ncbi:hypothetical protein RI367_007559 [Sorochytrium milnesiophthora]